MTRYVIQYRTKPENHRWYDDPYFRPYLTLRGAKNSLRAFGRKGVKYMIVKRKTVTTNTEVFRVGGTNE